MADARIGIDVGGTFTDGVMVHDGQVSVAKVASRPGDIAGAILACCEALGAEFRNTGLFIHGTTVSTNAIIERTGQSIAHVTTAGYRDILFIRRGDSEPFNLHWQPPIPVVRRRHIFEVTERMTWDGTVDTPLDEANARQVAQIIAEKNYPAVSVTFLHSYANPEHETRMKEILAELCPDAMICTSYEVLPQYREFERSSTTAANAYLMPLVRRYLEDLTARIATLGYRNEPLIMQSNGGLTTATEAQMRPARTVRSGPAGCAIAAAQIAHEAGVDDAIFFDMGGTSTEVSVLNKGHVRWTPEIEFAWGVPIRFPSVDVHSIGAGGGSIAWVDARRFLKVGPQSAGADPGPACYDRGGQLPTTTDAQVVLGRLNPVALLGGEMDIDRALAERAIRDVIGEPLGMDLIDAARGIVEVNTNNMLQAIRLMTVNRGLDPKSSCLLALGGSGPLYAADLADLLGVSRIVIPPHSGLASALGMVLADFQHDASMTLLMREDRLEPPRIETVLQDLEREVHGPLNAAGSMATERIIQRTLDMRYAGQGFELPVPIDELTTGRDRTSLAGHVDEACFRRAKQKFHELHEREFGWREDSWPVEIVFARVAGRGVIGAKPTLRALGAQAGHRSAHQSDRGCYFFGHSDPIATPVINRGDAERGEPRDGPLIIEQMDTTTIVPPAWRAAVDEMGNIVLTKRR
jgi:N-methylhydantoinase A